MRRILIIAFSLFLLVSCKNKVAGGHLPPALMQQILLDISMAEAYSINTIDVQHRGGMKNTDSLSVYYASIFAHYKVTPEQFTKSLDWYKANPEEMDSVYTKLVVAATRYQNRLPQPPQPLPPPPPLALTAIQKTRKDDSIKKVKEDIIRKSHSHKTHADTLRKPHIPHAKSNEAPHDSESQKP